MSVNWSKPEVADARSNGAFNPTETSVLLAAPQASSSRLCRAVLNVYR
jgi:hypothetical protein